MNRKQYERLPAAMVATEFESCQSGRQVRNESPSDGVHVPLRDELESRFDAKIVTYDDSGAEKPGGVCNCCGGGPNVEPDWRGDPWYIYRAGICDSDQVYYSMLCEGCLEDIRAENSRRPQTERDLIAREVTGLLGDDLDGAQTMMDDLDPTD